MKRRFNLRTQICATLFLFVFLSVTAVTVALGATQLQINQAIQDGLAWLATQMISSPYSFEAGNTSGWSETLPPGATANVVTSHGGNYISYSPKDGTYFLQLKTNGPGSYSTLERVLTVNAGETISGWAAFDARDYSPYNDNSSVQILNYGGTVIATPWYESVSSVGDYGDSAWTNWTWTATTSGTYRVRYLIANALDSGYDSYALFDGQLKKGLSYFGTGSYPNYYYLANTAAAVLAFENEGHFPGGGTPYSDIVEKGLDYLFTHARKTAINPQTFGYPGRNDNPDTNGNGQGIYFSRNNLMYETGLVMQAIVASNTPDRLVETGQCTGMTYREVMEDVVDFLAWAQVDWYTGRGGWRYNIYNNRGGNSDNSVAQWPVLGLIAAEQWGIYAPPFVKDEMEHWVTYIQHPNGGSGYYHPNSMVNISKTGGLLVEFFYLGDDKTTPRVVKALNYVNSRWPYGPSGWYGNKGHPYAMFSVFKGLELLQVTSIPNAPANPDTLAGDWWGDYSHYLVNTQSHAGPGLGFWNGYYYWGRYLATPWDIVILQATVFPVSVDVVVPGAACDETGYEVSVHYSVERFTANGTLYIYQDEILYETVALVDFIGSDTVNFLILPASLGAHTWKAVLDVTGGGISTTAEDTDTSTVYTTPQVSGIPDQVAPFTPFDLDDFQTCECPDVDWQALGVPSGWTVTIDSNNVVTVTAPEGASDPVEITFEAIFHWPGIDCSDSDSAVFSPNRPPFAHPGKIYPEEKYYVDEGSSVELDGTASYDPDGDAITSYAWDLDDDGVFETPGAIVTFSAAALDGPAEFYVFLKVVDEHGAFGIGQAEVEVLDVPPIAEFNWSPEPQDEGSTVQFTNQSTSIIDPIVSWDWDFAGLGTSSDQNPSFIFEDNGTFTVTLTVTDDDGSSDTISHDVTINNVPPLVGPITGPMDPVQVGTPITVFAEFTDPGTADTHTATWDWGDGTTIGTVDETGGSGSVEDSHTYTEAGIHTLVLTVTDDDGGSGQSQFQYVVVYDPSAGFVTGGGWINSPAGAYMPDPSLFGKANFGFVAKYKKGANVPMGQTEFQFHVADLNFHSSSYEWLVVTGSNYARFKGAGTINGAGNYKFMLWAGDGSPDTFRIKIWQEDEQGNETVVYDNGFDQAIDKGSIVIHD